MEEKDVDERFASRLLNQTTNGIAAMNGDIVDILNELLSITIDPSRKKKEGRIHVGVAIAIHRSMSEELTKT